MRSRLIFWLLLAALIIPIPGFSAAPCIKHVFQSAKSDGADATQIQPSHWNDCHTETDASVKANMLASAVNAQTGTTYTVLNSDRGKLVTHSNGSAIAVTLPQAGASSEFIAGWFYDVQNRGAGTVTITPATSTIDGAASLALTTGQGVRIFSNGSNYFTQRGMTGGGGGAGFTDSAGLAATLSDETGSGLAVFNNTPTLTTPSISSFANAQHTHTNAAGGGQITDAALSAAVGGTKGGTGQTTSAQGDLLYGAAGNAWSVLAKNANATRYLSNTGTNNDPAWAQINLANGVTGTLPLANLATGGTHTVDAVEFNESDSNPTCAAGNYTIFADTSESKLKKCQNGVATDLDAVGSGDVSAAANFGTDNVILRSDGTGKGAQGSGVGVDDSSNITTSGTLTVGNGGSTSGVATFSGGTSGVAALGVADAAGTPARINLPTTTGSSGQFLKTDGATPQQTSWTNFTDIRWYEAAGCNNATAGPAWDLPVSNPAAAACVTGTNTQQGVLDFDATTDESAQFKIRLPTGWTGNIDFTFRWFATATTGSVTWCAQLVRVPDAATGDPAFPAQAAGNCVSDAAKGTTLQQNDATKTGVTCTSCAASDLVYVRISRDPDSTAGLTDDMAGDARLIGVEITTRRTL